MIKLKSCSATAVYGTGKCNSGKNLHSTFRFKGMYNVSCQHATVSKEAHGCWYIRPVPDNAEASVLAQRQRTKTKHWIERQAQQDYQERRARSTEEKLLEHLLSGLLVHAHEGNLASLHERNLALSSHRASVHPSSPELDSRRLGLHRANSSCSPPRESR